MVPHGGTAAKTTSSTIDEAFMDSILPTPPGSTPLWGPGSIPDNWADVCGFLKPPGSQRSWKVNKHGACSIPRKSLGLRHVPPIKAAITKCGFTWILLIRATRGPGKMRTGHAFH